MFSTGHNGSGRIPANFRQRERDPHMNEVDISTITADFA